MADPTRELREDVQWLCNEILGNDETRYWMGAQVRVLADKHGIEIDDPRAIHVDTKDD